MRVTAAAALVLAVAVSAMPTAMTVDQRSDCDRECMTTIVTSLVDSWVTHNPDTLPLAKVYKATENGHPAALSFMTLWRTVTKVSMPNLLAIDTTIGSAYLALDVSEGNDQTKAVVWGRIKVANKQITELELYINRSRGDHGFSFSADELPDNYKRWMSPPADRQDATRAQLQAIGAAVFNSSDNLNVSIASDCQFTEEGATVIDTGTNGNDSADPLGCSWRADRPGDKNARANLVVDEDLGIVVSAGVVPGKVYAYANISAFIPDDIAVPQAAQAAWFEQKKAEGEMVLLEPTAATGQTINVVQYYNDLLQGYQINVYLTGPTNTSAWAL